MLYKYTAIVPKCRAEIGMAIAADPFPRAKEGFQPVGTCCYQNNSIIVISHPEYHSYDRLKDILLYTFRQESRLSPVPILFLWFPRTRKRMWGPVAFFIETIGWQPNSGELRRKDG